MCSHCASELMLNREIEHHLTRGGIVRGKLQEMDLLRAT